MRLNTKLEEILCGTDIIFSTYYNPKSKEIHFCFEKDIPSNKAEEEFYWSKDLIVSYKQQDISVNDFVLLIQDLWSEFDVDAEVSKRKAEIYDETNESISSSALTKLVQNVVNIEKSLNSIMDNAAAQLFGIKNKAFILSKNERGKNKE